ncbi:hypothetical protein HY02_07425 [Peptococcaceae bacterium SCADC1_2_3]|jgi:hypothetical protein|nr:hypothetical protein DK28_0214620 [Peptococcaceae bacterium SCADC1_2_3]KFI37369.1 hypothetical protein HY02_07425 [Peptococcaceae bacterium SCADC1_2_3]
MHVRLQTWFPFEIQVYINGREYLARKLDREGIEYTRYDNSFIDLADLEKAQELADQIESRKFSRTFDNFAERSNPILKRIDSKSFRPVTTGVLTNASTPPMLCSTELQP